MARNKGPRAFPIEVIKERISGRATQWGVNEGMSLLDYFAGQVIIGLLSNPKNKIFEPCEVSKLSYDIADAMICERNKQ